MKNILSILILILLVAVGGIETASQEQRKPDPCPDAMTQQEINRCAGEYFRKSDAVLNKVYRRILKQLNASDRTNLIEAQRAWVKYRSANCWAQRERRFHGGSLAPTEEAFCLRDITEARTKELIRIYETDQDK